MGYLSFVLKRSFSSQKLQPLSIHKLLALSEAKREIQVEGWVQRSQKQGSIIFLWLNDGSSPKNLQVVIPKHLISSVPVGSAIKAIGSWQQSSGTQQSMELLTEALQVLATDTEPRYTNLSPDILRKKLYLRSKSPFFAALLRLRSQLTRITHNFFMDRDFCHIDTPTFTANDCEGAGETFSAMAESKENFFGQNETYLTVSGQLHLEAIVSGIIRAYTFNGTYRADKQQSSSHLSEFKMIEAEIAFCEELNTLQSLVSEYVNTCALSILSNPSLLHEYENLGPFTNKDHLKVLEQLAHTPVFPQITYTEAHELLLSKGHTITGNGFSKKNEAFLVDYFNSPVFVTHFPSSQKPFYMKRTNNNLTESFDFLCPIVGELAGGSIRESNADLLKSQSESIDWYLETRKRGKPISGGFGIGFERLLQTLLGVRNIKDTIPFPRWFNHCQC